MFWCKLDIAFNTWCSPKEGLVIAWKDCEKNEPLIFDIASFREMNKVAHNESIISKSQFTY